MVSVIRKGVIAVLVILLIILFISLQRQLTKNNATKNRTGNNHVLRPTPTSTVSDISVVQATSDFYDEYDQCMEGPPAEASGQVNTYCQSHNPFGSIDLPAHLETRGTAAKGADPILCTQNPPERVMVKSAKSKGDNGTAVLVETSGKQTVLVDILLIRDQNAWKVTDIVCPQP